MTQPTYATAEVIAFVAHHSKMEDVPKDKLPSATHTFRDGTTVKHRDVYKKIHGLMEEGEDGALNELSAGAWSRRPEAKKSDLEDTLTIQSTGDKSMTNAEEQTSDATLTEGQTIDLSPEGASKPKKERKAREPKEPKPARPDMTDEANWSAEDKAMVAAYRERYKDAKKPDGSSVNLDTETKGGTPTKLSILARARMAMGAGERWTDTEKRAALQAAMTGKRRKGETPQEAVEAAQQ